MDVAGQERPKAAGDWTIRHEILGSDVLPDRRGGRVFVQGRTVDAGNARPVCSTIAGSWIWSRADKSVPS